MADLGPALVSGPHPALLQVVFLLVCSLSGHSECQALGSNREPGPGTTWMLSGPLRLLAGSLSPVRLEAQGVHRPASPPANPCCHSP